MMNSLCHTGAMGFLGNSGQMGGIGMLLFLLSWLGAIVGITLLVIWVLRHVKTTNGKATQAAGQPSTGEFLQGQFAGGEISQEQNGISKYIG